MISNDLPAYIFANFHAKDGPWRFHNKSLHLKKEGFAALPFTWSSGKLPPDYQSPNVRVGDSKPEFQNMGWIRLAMFRKKQLQYSI